MRSALHFRTIALACVVLVSIAAPVLSSAQSAHAQDTMAGMHHPAPVTTVAAKAEIAKVAKGVAPLGTRAAARQSGFAPAFGWIPTMGEHWVNRAGLGAGSPTDRMAPNNLMFSRIDGRDSLVGAAYAYYAPISDSTRPSLFDGAPKWHEHANLAPAGQTLVMLRIAVRALTRRAVRGHESQPALLGAWARGARCLAHVGFGLRGPSPSSLEALPALARSRGHLGHVSESQAATRRECRARSESRRGARPHSAIEGGAVGEGCRRVRSRG